MDECCNEACINELGLDKCKYSNKLKCPRGCLHGWLPDYPIGSDKEGNEILADIPCGRCDTRGFIDGD